MKDALPVVVLGIGNTLMQDDGLGVWAIRALRDAYDLPPEVRLIEGGVGGLRLLSVLHDAGFLLMIDAVRKGGVPGTLYRLTPGTLPRRRGPVMSAHEVGISELLSVAELVGKLPRTVILGIEPQEVQKVGLEMTPSIQQAIPRVVEAVVAELRGLGIKVKQKEIIERPAAPATSSEGRYA